MLHQINYKECLQQDLLGDNNIEILLIAHKFIMNESFEKAQELKTSNPPKHYSWEDIYKNGPKYEIEFRSTE